MVIQVIWLPRDSKEQEIGAFNGLFSGNNVGGCKSRQVRSSGSGIMYMFCELCLRIAGSGNTWVLHSAGVDASLRRIIEIHT